MTEKTFTWRWLFAIALIGVIAGIAIGLFGGWVIAPVRSAAGDISSLNASAQNDYIVMVANSYSHDQDLTLAKDRLSRLKDQNIAVRVERLAKALAARNDPAAPNVADLAVALGSKDTSLQVLAATAQNDKPSAAGEAQPTKYAQSQPEDEIATSSPTVAKQQATTNNPSATVQPVTVATDAPTLVAEVASTATATNVPATVRPSRTAPPTRTTGPTRTPGPSRTPAPTRTPKPTNTAVRPSPIPQVAAPGPIWLPPLASDWPKTTFFRPANAAPGQEYWRLVKALYCDSASDGSQDGDGRNNCQALPGGPLGVSTYVMLLNPDGSRAEADLNVRFDNGGGGQVGPGIIGKKDPGDSCECNYSFESSNYLVQVAGPSDAVGGMCLCSRYKNFSSHSHVRYFFWFQKTIR